MPLSIYKDIRLIYNKYLNPNLKPNFYLANLVFKLEYLFIKKMATCLGIFFIQFLICLHPLQAYMHALESNKQTIFLRNSIDSFFFLAVHAF